MRNDGQWSSLNCLTKKYWDEKRSGGAGSQDLMKSYARFWLGLSASGLKFLLIGALVAGIFFRFVNLDRKVYWLDETYTSLRISGYTTPEAVQDLFDGRVLGLDELQKYQRFNPDKHWTDTVRSLVVDSPQHPPFYFLMVRQWVQGFGNSVTAIRSLSAVISLLVFPAVYWLCRELFADARSGWLAIGLIAISPFHVLYAQEARQYSLWTVTILLSTAALLRAMRLQTKRSWILYGINLIFLLYSFLFSLGVLAGHAIYVGINQGFKLSKTVVVFLMAAGVALFAFSPWIWVVISSQPQIQESTTWINRKVTLSFLIHRWIIHLSNLFFDFNLGYKYLTVPSLVLLVLVIYALWFLYRQAPKSVWILILTLILPISLALVLPDLVTGGRRSTIARYLIPSYLGIQLAVTYLLSQKLGEKRDRGQQIWKFVLIGLIISGIASCSVSAQAQFWWNKSPSTHQPYTEIARIVNQSVQPLLISDNSQEINNSFVCRMFALSYFLDSKVKLQLVLAPQLPKIPTGFKNVFVFSPSQAWVQKIAAEQNYQASLAFRDDVFWLWKLTPDRPVQSAG